MLVHLGNVERIALSLASVFPVNARLALALLGSQ
jgi:hypothetical protein